ncbi:MULTISPECIES: hypothetical protein [Rhodococcus]|uniref:Uncharacterized protein n=1 Tax=Rhodococcus maanshanensis TaxID=183556 RepID=A0A1H7WS11_9NOCA|nr:MULTISPECIES: hypothetical protein [Rhodococcus]SEM24273.1 hypothetical protein SAMN05444583_12856 [Rhodococcus maanshanensis]
MGSSQEQLGQLGTAAGLIGGVGGVLAGLGAAIGLAALVGGGALS